MTGVTCDGTRGGDLARQFQARAGRIVRRTLAGSPGRLDIRPFTDHNRVASGCRSAVSCGGGARVPFPGRTSPDTRPSCRQKTCTLSFSQAAIHGLWLIVLLLAPLRTSADFLYIPPDQPVLSSPETAVDVGDPVETGLWEIEPGELLRETLARWGDRAGFGIEIRTDWHWRMDERRQFTGQFLEAVHALEAGLAYLPERPRLAVTMDGATLLLMHDHQVDGDDS